MLTSNSEYEDLGGGRFYRARNGLMLPRNTYAFGSPFGSPFAAPMGGGGTVAFAPTDIAGLQLWLKADAGLFLDAAKTQPATNDNDAIYTWADQSGNGNDAIQAILAARPLVKLNILNSKAVVRFQGTDDALITTLTMQTQPMSIFVVTRKNNDLATNGTVINNSSATPYNVFWYGFESFTATGKQGMYKNSGGAPKQGSATLNSNTWYLWESVISIAGSISFYYNAIADGVIASGAAVSWTIAIGGAGYRPLIGDIAEIAIYDSALSTSNRQSVETYLNQRWNIY